MKKIVNPSTKKMIGSKSSGSLLVKRLDSLEINPKNEEWRARFCDKLIEYSLDPKSNHMKGFCVKNRIAVRTMEELVKRWPDIKEAWLDAKEFLGSHRYNSVWEKEGEKDLFFRDQHRYDADWHKEVNEYNAQLKKDDAHAIDLSRQVFVLQTIPHTGKVKPLEKKKEVISDLEKEEKYGK